MPIIQSRVIADNSNDVQGFRVSPRVHALNYCIRHLSQGGPPSLAALPTASELRKVSLGYPVFLAT